MLDLVDRQLSGIFSASTGFRNPLDGYLLLLGNSSCVTSSGGFEKIKSQKIKNPKYICNFPANYCKGKW